MKNTRRLQKTFLYFSIAVLACACVLSLVWPLNSQTIIGGGASVIGGGTRSTAAQIDAAAYSVIYPPVQGKARDLPVLKQVICGPAVTAETMTVPDAGVYGTLSLDSTNYVTAPAAKFTGAAAPDTDALYIYATEATMDPVVDLTDMTDVFIRFYLHPGVENTATDYRGVLSVQIRLRSSAGNYYRIASAYIFSTASNPIVTTSGWYECCVNLSQMSTHANFLPSEVNQIAILVNRRSVNSIPLRSMTPVITFDTVKVVTNDKPRIMFRFDDGNTSQYDMCGYLEQLGLRGTVGVISSSVGTTGKLTAAQLRLLQDSGHLLCNHGGPRHNNHDDADYRTDTDAFLASCETGRQWMLSQGFTKGASILMLPGGDWNHDWNSLVAPCYEFVWGTSNFWFRDVNVSSQYHTKYSGGVICDTLTYLQIKPYIDAAVTGKGVISLYFHGSGDIAEFKLTADYVKTLVDADTVDCITPYEYIRLP